MKARLIIDIETDDSRNPWKVAQSIGLFLKNDHPEVRNTITCHDLPQPLETVLRHEGEGEVRAKVRADDQVVAKVQSGLCMMPDCQERRKPPFSVCPNHISGKQS